MGTTVQSNICYSVLNFDMHAPNALPPLEHSSLILALKSGVPLKLNPNIYISVQYQQFYFEK